MTRQISPWTRADRLAWGFGVAVSLTVLARSWAQASGDLLPAEQTGAFDIGVVGVAVAALSCGLYLRRGRSLVSRRRLAVAHELRESYVLRPAATTELTRDIAAASRDLVAAPGMTRYHRADCQLATDKAANPASRVQHELAGRAPCGVCTP